MSKRDHAIIALLFVLAGFIWVRDLAWISSASDSLPIIVALPLFIWLGWPWTFRSEASPLSSSRLMLAALGFLTGVLTGSTMLLALGWAVLLWNWLSSRLKPEDHFRYRRLMVLPVMAFPWLTLDGEMIGWWFRLSGSWVTGNLFSLMGFDVLREGTQLMVQGLPVDVSAACSGLNVLQSMLIAGSVIAYIILGNHPGYWHNIILLIVFSWLANTIRVITICVAALTLTPEFASGLFHQWGGWLVLFLMFFLCWPIFSLQKTGSPDPEGGR
jgi:exosortase